jgi:hypothetical protein
MQVAKAGITGTNGKASATDWPSRCGQHKSVEDPPRFAKWKQLRLKSPSGVESNLGNGRLISTRFTSIRLYLDIVPRLNGSTTMRCQLTVAPERAAGERGTVGEQSQARDRYGRTLAESTLRERRAY